MIGKKSRYETPTKFAGESGEESVFGGIRPRKIGRATGVLTYTIKQGDRLDLLSLHFYNDTRRWWRILDANPEIICGADLMLSKYIGETILIPRSADSGGER